MDKSFVFLVSLRFYYGRNQYFFDIAEVEALEIDNKNVLPGPFHMQLMQATGSAPPPSPPSFYSCYGPEFWAGSVGFGWNGTCRNEDEM